MPHADPPEDMTGGWQDYGLVEETDPHEADHAAERAGGQRVNYPFGGEGSPS